MKKPLPQEELDALVKELSRGSVAAYSTIYRQYYNRLFRYGLQIHNQPDLVEDILQDFFTYLAGNYRKLRRVSNFEVYLFQSIKRNLLARLSREKQSFQSKDRYLRRMFPLEEKVATAPDLLLIQREEVMRRQEMIRDELAKLPEHLREILYLRFYEELNYKQICQILGLTNQVARNYTSRAISRLKAGLLDKELLMSVLFLLFDLYF